MTAKVLEQAINLIKAGDIEQGEKILVNILKENPKLERAWVWLYACVKTDDEKIYCLKKVLELNRGHRKAKSALEKFTSNSIAIGDPVTPTNTNEILEEGSKPALENTSVQYEHLVFKLDNYNVVITKPGDNQYAKTKHTLVDFPEIDSTTYGARLMIGGISITPNDHPKCIELGRIPHKSLCLICEFFSISDCPILRDPMILQEVKTLFVQTKRYRQEQLDRRDAVVETIYNELKDHGRPLHYEVLAKIIKDRHPRLHLNPIMIVHFMGWHPDKFEWVDVGVYRAK